MIKLAQTFPTQLHQILLKRESEQILHWLLLVLDILSLLIAAKVSYFYRHDTWVMPSDYIVLTVLSVPVFVIFQHVFGRYKATYMFYMWRQLCVTTLSTILTLGTLALILFFLKSGAEISRLWLGSWGITTVILTVVLYSCIVAYCRRQLTLRRYQRRVILVGNAAQIEMLKTHCEAHYMRVVGIHITFGNVPHALKILPNFQTAKALVSACVDARVDDVIMTARFGQSTQQEEEVLALLRQLPAAVRYCLSEVFIGKGVQIASKWKGLPIVTLYRKPMLRHQRVLKRGLDIVCASLALIVFGLPMLIVGWIVKFTSPGPMFFVQERGGFGGRIIPVIKFRSMSTLDSGRAQIQQATKNDARITPIGKIIRKFNLDELPQLINVLKGEMSLVGPRPHAISHDDAYAALIDSYAARHRMKPGITGWAQVNGLRGETDTLDKMEARVAHDLYYIENWSVWLDIKILLLTPITFFQKTAH